MSYFSTTPRSPLLLLSNNIPIENDTTRQKQITHDEASRIIYALRLDNPSENKLIFTTRNESRFDFARDPTSTNKENNENDNNYVDDQNAKSKIVTPQKKPGVNVVDQTFVTPVKSKSLSTPLENFVGAAPFVPYTPATPSTPSTLSTPSTIANPSTPSTPLSSKAEQENKSEETNALTPSKPTTKPAVEFKVMGPPKVTIVLLMPKAVPFTFAERVLIWQRHPSGKALDEPTFGANYASKPLHHQQKMLDFHSFSVAANYFYYIGTMAPFLNRITQDDDTEYSVAAEIVRKNNTYRGRAVWTVDDKNECYHKFFQDDNAPKKHIAPDVVQEALDDSFYDADFPTLETVKQKDNTPQKDKGKLMRLEGENVLVESGKVTITNHKRDNLRISLFS